MRPSLAIATLALISLYPAIGPGPAILTSRPEAAHEAALAPPAEPQAAAPWSEPCITDLPSVAPADAPGINPAPTAVILPDAPPKEAEVPQERILVVARGDTLASLLDGAGVDSADAHAAIERLARQFRPSQLRPGTEIAIRLSPGETPDLLDIEIEPEPGRTVRVARQPDGSWADSLTIAPRSRFLVRAEGSVDGGLFPAMTRSGVPAGMALSLIRILGHQVDFQRDLQPGDRFEVLFDRFRDDEGDVLGHGQILKATLTLSGRTLEVWRYKNRAGDVEWYDAQGRSLRRSFMRTPLDGARVSSGFGPRSHPVLGFNRVHQGIDFAAPTGTPIYAAAEGVIISAKREGGYGLMVRIRHANGVETRYAHMSRFARNATAGRRVRQGAVIGAVGSTGLSTGPHLHYEVVAGGRQVNPARHVQEAVRLAGADLAAFRARQSRITRIAAGFGSGDEIALASD
ncbi:M23 family metallopeptidase [Roseomonas rosulenta]|uniref:M23 family metallopeptidase n=1 Tax=Roseomonas rosulenta TaxID=2748667 RepID=UPI0018E0512A|nr:peptidoglycan DD-metalloendopeptidase family protein [Roseomonas rosulenta]